MRFSVRQKAGSIVFLAVVLSVCDVSYGGPRGSKEVVVIDLGEPGVTFSGVQQTEEVSPGKVETMSWLGANSEDAFLVVDATALMKKGWTFEVPKTGARLDGFVLLSAQNALRNPSEKRRTYNNILGMLYAFDENKDKKLSGDDFIFSLMYLFRDANNDGKIDAGEVTPLAKEQIEEMSLVYKGKAQRDSFGNNYKVIEVKKKDGSLTQAQLLKLK